MRKKKSKINQIYNNKLNKKINLNNNKPIKRIILKKRIQTYSLINIKLLKFKLMKNIKSNNKIKILNRTKISTINRTKLADLIFKI